MKVEVQERELAVAGFRFGATTCGIKESGAPDCGVIVADGPATAAAVFTRNRFAAAPVLIGRERLRRGRLQALVVNSGNANACTGAAGLAAARTVCQTAADALAIPAELVAPASTGIIGVELPVEKVAPGVRRAIADASEDGLWRFARAIMTTDAFPKVASETVSLGRSRVTITAVGKGAGMMAPDMATLLVFLVSDAVVSAPHARALLRAACADSFNALSVDGDTSTNDSLFLLASGRAGNRPPAAGSSALRVLTRAATSVAQEIARLVVADGEGASKVVKIEVRGARNDLEARRVAATVARSLLVKAAFHGEDPNWGRIACAIGYCGVAVRPERVSIRIGGVEVFREGRGLAGAQAAARAAMQASEFDVGIKLGSGRGRATFLTSDLSHEYVELNSAYST